MTSRMCFVPALLLFVFGVMVSEVRGQVPSVPRSASEFSEFQRALHVWLSDPEHRKRKGWKSLKRWEEFEARRMNADGSSGDPRAYAEAVTGIAVQKVAATGKTSGGGWIPIGPDNYPTPTIGGWVPGIGRINCIAFHPSSEDIFWVGVAQGGVWKTLDGGQSWMPLTDDLPMLRVSDIAVNPLNPNEMYLSMGDYAYIGAGLNLDNRKRHTHYGLGVYKTVDGGQTWNPTGLSITQTDFDFSLTRRVFVHPTQPQNLLAAGSHGVWRSSDSGGSWVQVNDSLIWDIERDPANPSVFYAATGYRSSMNVGHAGVIKSVDGGQSWVPLPIGVAPQGQVQRIELAIAPSNSSVIYALCSGMDAGFAGLYRSGNGGASWSLRSDSPNILSYGDGADPGGQGWYDLAIIVNPFNPEVVYTGGINIWTFENTTQTWYGTSYWLEYYGPTVHADQHQLAYNPVSGKYYLCNDGGLYVTDSIVPGSWDDALNIPGYQWPTVWTPLSGGMQATSFYRLGTSRDNPNYVIAGSQDNSTYYFDTQMWWNITGGDGMDCFIDPQDPAVVYSSSQYGGLSYSMDGGQTENWIAGIPEQAEWTAPWMLDPNDNGILYAGFGNVWKSTDQGGSWNAISNLPVNGGLGQPNLCSALDVAPSNSNYLYVAKRVNYGMGELGSLWVTTNGGGNWVDRTAGLPDSLYFTSVEVDANDALHAWVTTGGFMTGRKVYETTDAGASWVNVSGNLPNLPANVIVQDPLRAHNPVYVGMDVGVWYKNDTMNNWVLFSTDLPNVIVSDLEVHVGTERIYAATFGRGLWGADLRDAGVSAIGEGMKPVLELALYPNPSRGVVRLKLEGVTHGEAEVGIVNTMGRRVYQQQVGVAVLNQGLELKTGLAAGVYYCVVDVDGSRVTRKFVVQ